jgi:hypothetical protein
MQNKYLDLALYTIIFAVNESICLFLLNRVVAPTINNSLLTICWKQCLPVFYKARISSHALLQKEEWISCNIWMIITGKFIQ